MSGLTNILSGTGVRPALSAMGSGGQPGDAAAALMARPRQPDLWYREPWLLLVVGGPALVIVACAVTLYLAISRPDPLVNKDYYRDGLRINQIMAAEEAARALVLSRSHHDASAAAGAPTTPATPAAQALPASGASSQGGAQSRAAGGGKIDAHQPSDELEH